MSLKSLASAFAVLAFLNLAGASPSVSLSLASAGGPSLSSSASCSTSFWSTGRDGEVRLELAFLWPLYLGPAGTLRVFAVSTGRSDPAWETLLSTSGVPSSKTSGVVLTTLTSPLATNKRGTSFINLHSTNSAGFIQIRIVRIPSIFVQLKSYSNCANCPIDKPG